VTPELLYPSHPLLEERHVSALLVADVLCVGRASLETDRKLIKVRSWGKGEKHIRGGKREGGRPWIKLMPGLINLLLENDRWCL